MFNKYLQFFVLELIDYRNVLFPAVTYFTMVLLSIEKLYDCFTRIN